jgi:cystathionine beta-synthase
MEYYENILELVGNTPLVKLNKVTNSLKPNMFVKVETWNPGRSVKDRIAISIIEDAEKKGILKPGGRIVESTSGNTGIGLALVATLKGYKLYITIPDKMSDEKIRHLRAFGAEVTVCPTAVLPDDPRSYYSVAKKIAREKNAFYTNQYTNMKNVEAHYKTTGPEIWKQTDGKIDALVATMGTGGTITGAGRYLKEKNPAIKLVGVDPEGSAFQHEKKGETWEDKIHPYKVEGFGEDFIPDTIDLDLVDEIIVVNDKDSFLMGRKLVRLEGLFVGGSSGSAVWAAIEYAKKHPEMKNIVVILPDDGWKYLSKMFNDEWMIENSYLERGKELEANAAEIIGRKSDEIPAVISVQKNEKVSKVIELMKEYGISEVIVKHEPLSLVSESVLLSKVLEDKKFLHKKMTDVPTKPLAIVQTSDSLGEIRQLMSEKAGLVGVMEKDKLVGVITKIDIINYLEGVK